MSLDPVSLLDRAWLPVRRASGERDRIRPAQLPVGIDDDPIVAFDWSRPDHDAASRELMIGLLSTACFREVVDVWADWWQEPPEAGVLDDRFASVEQAFLLDGSGSRFLQDLEELDGDPVPAAALLIDSPGANALRKNIDLFVKRGRVSVLSRPAAAIALFALNAFAPAGGAGHRTSLRGGGPLTTLLLPGPAAAERPVPLWHQLWANVFWDEAWENPTLRPGRVFPWLAPTRLSDKGRTTTPEDVHPAQAYWGMPRRIRLDFEVNEAGLPCDVTGEIDRVVVRTYRTRPHGTHYNGWSLGHPLSPYYRAKPTDPEWLPVHPQPGRLGYRDWVGLVLGDDSGKALAAPAAVIVQARERLRREARGVRLGARLLATGYDMDNMKARGLVESEMPVRILAEATPPHVRQDFEALVRQLVLGAREVQSILAGAVRTGLWGLDAPDASAGARGLARERFWDETEGPFHDTVARLAEALEAHAEDAETVRRILGEVREDWYRRLRRTALAIFDALVSLDEIEERRFERVERGRSLPGGPIAARRNLLAALSGYGRSGAAFFAALGRAVPQPGDGKRKRSKAA